MRTNMASKVPEYVDYDSTTIRFSQYTGQALEVSRPLGGQLHTRMLEWDIEYRESWLRPEQPKQNVIKIELHHGSRKSVATLRTVRTLIVRYAHYPSHRDMVEAGRHD